MTNDPLAASAITPLDPQPCPFCGGKPERLNGDDRWTQIGCRLCFAKGPEFMQDWPKAIAGWNRRPAEVRFSRAVKEPCAERVLPVRDAAEFAFRAVADTLLTVLLELPNRYGDNHTIDRRIAIAAAQKMKADALRAIDSAILNGYIGRTE